MMKNREKLCGVVTLYNPSQDVVENITSYIEELGKLYVYDNSPKKNNNVYAQLAAHPNVEFLFNRQNDGIATALPHDWHLERGLNGC